MSTVKTTNLQHASAGSPAIVLDADGDATYAGTHDFSAATVTGIPVTEGLTHINTTTFSAVSSVSLDDVFTGTYENYKLVIDGTTSVSANFYFRLRVGGTDNSASVYSYIALRSFTGSAANQVLDNTRTEYILSAGSFGADGASMMCDIFSPQLAVNTRANSLVSAYYSSNAATGLTALTHRSATSFDGMTIYPSAGTFTGTIRVYGYKNGA